MQNNHTNYEKLKDLNLSELRTQIAHYHHSNHASFKQIPANANTHMSKIQYNPAIDTNSAMNKQSNLNAPLNKNQHLMSFLVKSFKSSASSLTNTEFHSASGIRKSPSIFTSLSAPRASIDCYQLSESPSLNDINNNNSSNNNNLLSSRQNSFQYNDESIGKASSVRVTPTLTLTPSPTVEYNSTAQFKLSSLGIDKILDECVICKGFAISALNTSRSILSNQFKNQSFDEAGGSLVDVLQLNDYR